MKYDKLVRDKIPNIIKEHRKYPLTHTASDEEYKEKLDEKLLEEVQEYLVLENLEELADIIEVIYAICDYNGVSIEELENMRKKKANERGRFLDKIILERVED